MNSKGSNTAPDLGRCMSDVADLIDTVMANGATLAPYVTFLSHAGKPYASINVSSDHGMPWVDVMAWQLSAPGWEGNRNGARRSAWLVDSHSFTSSGIRTRSRCTHLYWRGWQVKLTFMYPEVHDPRITTLWAKAVAA